MSKKSLVFLIVTVVISMLCMTFGNVIAYAEAAPDASSDTAVT